MWEDGLRGLAYLGFVEEFYGNTDCGGEFAHGGLGPGEGSSTVCASERVMGSFCGVKTEAIGT